LFADFSLDERLTKTLEKLGFDQPTPIQQQVIPQALLGLDLMASAETGSGKTAAFLLPALQRLLKNPHPGPNTRMLILVPTRELARQTVKHFEQLAQLTHLRVGLITGGADFKYQKSLLRKNPEVVIATPGRILEHLAQNTPDFSGLEILVLDEADRMLDMGLRDEVLEIVAACGPQRQTMMFSASLNHRALAEISSQLLNEPQIVRVGSLRQPHQAIRQQIVLADDVRHKEKLLGALLNEEAFDKALIFTNTRDRADRLLGLVHYFKHKAGVLHGEKTQETRNRVMHSFRSGGIKVLIASDVAARGLDIEGVDLVINFDFARKGTDYAHRIGRTGRAGKSGLALSLVTTSEWNLMVGIERYLNLKFERRKVNGLEGSFKGPKKLKASGKAAGSKKKKSGKIAPGKTSKGKQSSKARAASKKAGNKARNTADTNKSPAKKTNDGFGPLRK